jgi:4-hydroxy-tetrahydrodipicolinate synthase
MGCISASANATSQLSGKLYQNWQSDIADELQESLTQARMSFESTSFVSGLKFLFSEWTGNQNWKNIRPPNVMPSLENQSILLQSCSNPVQ